MRMSTSVVHYPRVAWDLAQTAVAMAAGTEQQSRWFAEQIALRLGPAAGLEVDQTRRRLIADERVDVHPVELGRWRVRIEDALTTDPALGADLAQLRTTAQSRLHPQ
jgi:hypothetical protein